MYQRKKINDVKVKVIKVPTLKPEEIKGYEIIPEIHANIFICGRKGSGKTNVTFTIMKKCIDQYTNVIIFCPTHASDHNWKAIKKWLEKKDQPHAFFDGIHDEDGHNNLEMLQEKILQDNAALEEKERKPEKVVGLLDDAPGIVPKEKVEKTNKKLKQKGPKYLLIFDDISQDLRGKADVQKILRKMRHYDMKIIVSSQFPTDLDPAARTQIDFWMLFKGFTEQRMESVFPQLDLNDMEFENFYKVYLEETKEAHHFLYIDRIHEQIRSDFSEEILFSKTSHRK